MATGLISPEPRKESGFTITSNDSTTTPENVSGWQGAILGRITGAITFSRQRTLGRLTKGLITRYAIRQQAAPERGLDGHTWFDADLTQLRLPAKQTDSAMGRGPHVL